MRKVNLVVVLKFCEDNNHVLIGFCVAKSKSEGNCENASNSLKCANANFKEPATCFIALY